MTAREIVGKLFDRKLRRFLLVGVFNTIFGMSMMFGFYRILGLGYWGSSGLSYFIASIVSYLLNKNYTFNNRAGHIQSGLKFALNIGICYLLAYMIAKPAVRFVLGIAGSLVSPALLDQLAMLAGMVFFTGINYIGQRFFVFPESKEQSSINILKPRMKALSEKQHVASTPEGAKKTSAEEVGIYGMSTEENVIPLKPLYLALSFLLPFLIMGIAFALHGLYPFGSQQILAGSDSTNQYYPFLSEYWQRLRSGASLLWSWTGGGFDYLGFYAYYLACPFNFLISLLPRELLREAMAVLILIKLGLSGLFMSIYIRGTFRRCDMSLPIFSLFYALCAFTLGYYLNFMWLDTIALLPLVVLGTQSFFKEGKYRLYIASLSLSVYCNYYFGIYTCIFVSIVFFSLCILHKLNFRQLCWKFFSIIFYSLIALGMTALLLLPAYSNLQSTVNFTKDSFPFGLSFYFPFSDIFGNLIAFIVPTIFSDNNLPSLYSGILTIILASAFISLPKIKLREKVVFLFIPVFIFFSCNFQPLNYIWNGFYTPNGIFSRYLYLFSFTIIVIAYRAFITIEQTDKQDPHTLKQIAFYLLFICAASMLGFIITEFKVPGSIYVIFVTMLCGYYLAGYFIFTKNLASKPEIKEILLVLLFMGASVAFVLFMAKNGPQDNKYVTDNAIICCVYIIIYFVFLRGTQKFRKAAIALSIVTVLMEVSVTTYIGVDNVGSTSRNDYPDKYNQIEQLLNLREQSDQDFYRTEFYKPFIFNDPHLYDYNGISFYSSTASDCLTHYLTSLGLSCCGMPGKAYVYAYPSPLADAFVNLRYLVDHDKSAKNDFFWRSAAESEDVLLLENNYSLPLGFMVNTEIMDYDAGIQNPAGRNPFLTQNDLFKRATGLDGDLFTLIKIKEENHDNYSTKLVSWYDDSFNFLRFSKKSGNDDAIGVLRWDYQIPRNGMYYAYYTNSNCTHMLNILINNQPVDIIDIQQSSGFVFPVGDLEQNDILSLLNPISSSQGSVNLHVARIDVELFIQGYRLLSTESMQLEKFSDTTIIGDITTARNGLLYTSIPYEKNKWKAYVNGVNADIIPIGGAMSALRLTPGVYHIEFRYHNPYFTAGVIVSFISVVAFIVMIIKDRYKSLRVPVAFD